MHHLIGKLLEHILGQEIMMRLCGGMFALFGGVWLIACILSIRESLRQRRTPEPTPRFVVWTDSGRVLSDPAEHTPIWKVFVALPFAAALAVLGIWLLLHQRTAEERAIDAIKDAKGEVEVDAARPGKPVVKVSFRDSRRVLSGKLNDKDLKSLKPHLEALAELRELDLVHTDITDEGLDYLKGLTRLKVLSLGEPYWPKNMPNMPNIPNMPKSLSQARVDELQRSLPETKINFYGYERLWIPRPEEWKKFGGGQEPGK
jgi:hypothetical protein